MKLFSTPDIVNCVYAGNHVKKWPKHTISYRWCGSVCTSVFLKLEIAISCELYEKNWTFFTVLFEILFLTPLSIFSSVRIFAKLESNFDRIMRHLSGSLIKNFTVTVIFGTDVDLLKLLTSIKWQTHASNWSSSPDGVTVKLTIVTWIQISGK